MMNHFKFACRKKTLMFTILTVVIATGFQQKLHSEDHILGFKTERNTIAVLNEAEAQWFHPRACYLPPGSNKSGISGVLTIQKHLGASDFYSGMSVMYQNQSTGQWSSPVEVPELKWRRESKEVIIGVCDVTPMWHATSKKVIAIGVQLRYSNEGVHLYDKYRSYNAAYSVFDPETKKWSLWKAITDGPNGLKGKKYHLFAPGCTQFYIKDDGTILLPIYYGDNKNGPFGTTVTKCAFDGTELKILEHGNEMELDVVRGLCEPSIAKFQNQYYLTVRNDVKAYITTSKDGLNYDPIKPWMFDDGEELGSYNTQQHWLAHSDGLFLVYTRKNKTTPKIMRHRAPLFMAQVDPEKLQIIRKTEQAIVPNRGAQLGNFGANRVNEKESWVTVSEGVFGNSAQRKEKQKSGANGSTFLIRVFWDQPNKLAK